MLSTLLLVGTKHHLFHTLNELCNRILLRACHARLRYVTFKSTISTARYVTCVQLNMHTIVSTQMKVTTVGDKTTMLLHSNDHWNSMKH